MPGDLSEHFNESEFLCPCCGAGHGLIDPQLIQVLEEIHETLPPGVPMAVTSGYRCAAHNAAVGGESDSEHLVGQAADIAAGDNLKREIVKAALDLDVQRIGVMYAAIHIGVSQTLPQSVIWGYKDR